MNIEYNLDGTVVGIYDDIQEGVDNCPAGGIVSVSAGTYNEAVYINKRISLVGVDTPTITTSGLDNTNTATLNGTSTEKDGNPRIVGIVDMGAYEYQVAATPPLNITTTSPLPSGRVNTYYQTALTATGGTPPNHELHTGMGRMRMAMK